VLVLFGVLLHGLYLSAITLVCNISPVKFTQIIFKSMMLFCHARLGVAADRAGRSVFGAVHMSAAVPPQPTAIKIGYAPCSASRSRSWFSGLLFDRVGSIADRPIPTSRSFSSNWAHVNRTAVVIWLYWLHRLVGPRIPNGTSAKRGRLGDHGRPVWGWLRSQASDPRDQREQAPEQGRRGVF